MIRWFLIIGLCISFMGCQSSTTTTETEVTTSSYIFTGFTTTTRTTQSTTERSILTTPAHQTIEAMGFSNNWLSWKAYPLADSYRVSVHIVDLDEWIHFDSVTTSLEFTTIPFGNVVVQVQAYKAGSPISSKQGMQFVYRPVLGAPNVIWIDHGILHWNAVEHATSYVIELHSHEPIEVDGSVTSYDIGALIDFPAEWIIQMTSRNPFNLSQPSDPFTVYTDNLQPFTLTVAYPKDANADFVFDTGIPDLEIYNITGDLYTFNLEQLMIQQGVITIANEYLQSIPFNSYLFLLTTNKGEFTFRFRLLDNLSTYRRTYHFIGAIAGMDFDVFIPGLADLRYLLTGYQIKPEHYTLFADRLRIHYEFVESVYQNRADLKVAVFTISIQDREYGGYHIIYLTILPYM